MISEGRDSAPEARASTTSSRDLTIAAVRECKKLFGACGTSQRSKATTKRITHSTGLSDRPDETFGKHLGTTRFLSSTIPTTLPTSFRTSPATRSISIIDFLHRDDIFDHHPHQLFQLPLTSTSRRTSLSHEIGERATEKSTSLRSGSEISRERFWRGGREEWKDLIRRRGDRWSVGVFVGVLLCVLHDRLDGCFDHNFILLSFHLCWSSQSPSNNLPDICHTSSIT